MYKAMTPTVGQNNIDTNPTIHTSWYSIGDPS